MPAVPSANQRQHRVGREKRNAIAGQRCERFAALEAFHSEWIGLADQRVYGTTHEVPAERFESRVRDEVFAAAILDRLLHQSFTLTTQGEGYSLKQKQKAGLLGSQEKQRN